MAAKAEHLRQWGVGCFRTANLNGVAAVDLSSLVEDQAMAFDGRVGGLAD